MHTIHLFISNTYTISLSLSLLYFFPSLLISFLLFLLPPPQSTLTLYIEEYFQEKKKVSSLHTSSFLPFQVLLLHLYVLVSYTTSVASVAWLDTNPPPRPTKALLLLILQQQLVLTKPKTPDPYFHLANRLYISPQANTNKQCSWFTESLTATIFMIIDLSITTTGSEKWSWKTLHIKR